MNGIIVLDKPKGLTSFDCIRELRNALNIKRIGHTGTLDPLATGVLVVCLNDACKAIEFLELDDKEYECLVHFGVLTDTFDAEGNVLLHNNEVVITNEMIDSVIPNFLGDIEQLPPIYSALKKDGKPLYYYARNNIDVIIDSRIVHIFSIERIGDVFKDKNDYFCKIKVHCSKGTYIRSLVNDLGKALNSNAIVEELRRTRVGNFDLSNCNTLDDVKENKYFLRNTTESINYPKIQIEANTLLYKKIYNGMKLSVNDVCVEFKNINYICFINGENIIAIYEKSDSYLKAKKVWNN